MSRTCTGWDEKLNAAHDGELGAADRAALDAHLSGCADCRRTLEALDGLDRDLGLLRTDSKPLEDRIIAAAHAEPRPRRWRMSLLAAAAVLLFAFAALRPRPAATPPVASLRLATGPVEVWNGRDWCPLAPGGTLQPGDSVRTGELAKCELVVSDGSIVRLNTSTEVVVHQKRQIELRQGELFARVAVRPETMSCTTEASTVEAAEATFNLSVDATAVPGAKRPQWSSQLTVIDGAAKMSGTQDVPPGSMCRVASGQPPVPGPADPYLQTRWVHELLRLKSGPSPELDRRVGGLLAKINRSKAADLYEKEIRALGDQSIPGLFLVVVSPPPELKEYDRRTAAKLLSDLAGPAHLPYLVAMTKDASAEISGIAGKSLTRLTGETLPGADAWERWLRDHHTQWSCAPTPPEPPPRK